MNKRTGLKLLMIVLAVLLVAFSMTGCGAKPAEEGAEAPAELTKMTVTYQPSIDAYPQWKAIKDGLDKEKGLEETMLFFDSGMPQIEAIPSKSWQAGSTGNVPMLMGALRYDAYAIGVAMDESVAQGVLARPDNPVFNTTGFDPAHPEAFGKPEDVKGKTFLVTTVSSGHYVLSKYLKAMGLTEKDVVIKNLEQAQAIAAFEAGEGDFVVAWTPFLYRAYEKGWKMVANGTQVGANVLMVLIAEKEYADAHPADIVKFLDIYLTKVEQLKTEGVALTADVQEFFVDWSAQEMSAEDIKMDIETHPIYTLEEQLVFMENGQFATWLSGATDFFVSQGKFTAEEAEQLKAKNYGVNDTFMKELAKQKGITQ